MTDQALYNAGRALAVILMIAASMIAAAANAPDTGLTKQAVSWLAVVQAGIAVALGVLPQIQRPALNRRGDSTDN
jgi:uncharacterized membrane protein